MIDELAEIIKALKLSYYKFIEVLDHKLILVAENLPAMQYKVFNEALQIVNVIDTDIYLWEYNDEENMLTITLR